MLGNANRGIGAVEGTKTDIPLTLIDDKISRIQHIEGRLVYLREKMDSLANRLYGRPPEVAETVAIPGPISNDAPTMEVLHQSIYGLEIASRELEHTLNRFNDLA